MDEAEKYQQRLQAIEEKRRQQEEEERLKREKEEEWLKLAQLQRKSLRDQWLSESAPAPVPPVPVPPPPASKDAPEPQQDQQHGKHPVWEQTGIHNSAEEEEEEGWEVLKVTEEEERTRHADGLPIHCTASNAHGYSQAITEEEALLQVISAAEGHFPEEMTQRMFLANGQDVRSVLGMVAVQVERDPKTGATVVRSVAPVPAPEGAPVAAMTTTVFDDGRKSVHAVGGSGAQPSAQELGQILSAIDGVGLHVLLDEVTVTPPRGDGGTDEVGGTRPLTVKEEVATKGGGGGGFSVGSGDRRPGAETEGGYESRGEEMKDGGGGGGDDRAVREVRGRAHVEDEEGEYPLESGPVTLTFLGYADAQTQGVGREDNGALLTVERVVITDEGEEEEEEAATAAAAAAAAATRPQASHVSQPGLHKGLMADGDEEVETVAAGEAAGSGDQTRASFQEVPLGGGEEGVRAQGVEAKAGVEENPLVPAGRSGGEGTPKRKTCQCCSLM